MSSAGHDLERGQRMVCGANVMINADNCSVHFLEMISCGLSTRRLASTDVDLLQGLSPEIIQIRLWSWICAGYWYRNSAKFPRDHSRITGPCEQ